MVHHESTLHYTHRAKQPCFTYNFEEVEIDDQWLQSHVLGGTDRFPMKIATQNTLSDIPSSLQFLPLVKQFFVDGQSLFCSFKSLYFLCNPSVYIVFSGYGKERLRGILVVRRIMIFKRGKFSQFCVSSIFVRMLYIIRIRDMY